MKKRLFVLSIDAMVSEDLEILKTLPAFSEILQGASIVENVESIYPTLTHPAHVTISTGCYAGHHGIISNGMWIPGDGCPPWCEEASLVKVPTLMDVAHEKGLTCASVFWPLTLGAPIDWMLFRPGIHTYHRDHREVIRENSTPGLFEEVRDIVEPCWGMEHYAESDQFCFLAGEYILEQKKPDIMFVHIVLMDHLRHAYGVFSDHQREGYEFFDRGLRRYIDAMKRTGTFDETIFCITSDHGHENIQRVVSVNRFFADHGLITVQDGILKDWKAYCYSNGLSAYICVRDPKDSAAVQQLLIDHRQLLGISCLFTREETKDRFLLDGPFDFVIETDDDTAFSDGIEKNIVTGVEPSDYRSSLSTHGHLPWKGPQPMMIIRNPFKEGNVTVGKARLVDEAPTLAALMGLKMEGCDGKPICPIVNLPDRAAAEVKT